MSLLGIQWMELNKSVTLPRFGIRGVVQVPASTAADWYKNQPSMQLIKAGSARSYSTGSGVVVADINSNLDYAHPALIGHLTSGYDFVATRPPGSPFLDQAARFHGPGRRGFMDQADAGFMDQADARLHGPIQPHLSQSDNRLTHTARASAGIIAAIAPGSMIMPLRAFDDDGHTDLFTLAKAIRFAVDHGAQVINLIFGSFTPSLAINKAVQFAEASNVLLVASRRERQNVSTGVSIRLLPEYWLWLRRTFRHKGLFFKLWQSCLCGCAPELTYFRLIRWATTASFRVHPSVRPRLRRRRQLYVPCRTTGVAGFHCRRVCQYRWPKSNLRAAVRNRTHRCPLRCPGRNTGNHHR